MSHSKQIERQTCSWARRGTYISLLSFPSRHFFYSSSSICPTYIVALFKVRHSYFSISFSSIAKLTHTYIPMFYAANKNKTPILDFFLCLFWGVSLRPLLFRAVLSRFFVVPVSFAIFLYFFCSSLSKHLPFPLLIDKKWRVNLFDNPGCSFYSTTRSHTLPEKKEWYLATRVDRLHWSKFDNPGLPNSECLLCRVDTKTRK